MKVTIEEISPIERKLSIEVDAPRVAQELDRAYTALSRHVKVAGFRPGKVPRRILEQRFKEQVEDDVIHRVVESAFLEAVREHKVDAVGSPRVTNDRLQANAPFSFEARVEVKPKLEPKDYKGLPLKKLEVQVDEAKVNEQIEQMRNSMSRLEPVEGREVVEAGDFATVDFSATVDGKEFPGSKAENLSLEVAPGELLQSKCESLAGARVGETRPVDYTFPGDYRVEELRGKTARFDITVKGLKRRLVPELNDELAKELGAGQTLDELRARVKQDLEKGERARLANDERTAIVEKLIERNPFEVPRALVDRMADSMIESALRAFARSGVDPRQLNLDLERLREEMRPKALTEVKGTLLLEAIAQAESIQATDMDVDERVEQMAKDAGSQGRAVRQHFRNPQERLGVQLRLREEKTIEFLKGQASYS